MNTLKITFCLNFKMKLIVMYTSRFYPIKLIFERLCTKEGGLNLTKSSILSEVRLQPSPRPQLVPQRCCVINIVDKKLFVPRVNSFAVVASCIRTLFVCRNNSLICARTKPIYLYNTILRSLFHDPKPLSVISYALAIIIMSLVMYLSI